MIDINIPMNPEIPPKINAVLADDIRDCPTRVQTMAECSCL